MASNQQQYIDELLDKYLLGNCSPDEEKLIDKWYEELSVSDRDLLNEDPAFALLAEQQLRQQLKGLPDRAPGKVLAMRRYSRGRVRTFRLAAASFAGILLISGYFRLFRYGGGKQVVWSSVSTQRNQLKKIDLPDGSVAWINQFSTLRWAADFNDSTRIVELSGESRLNIAADPSRPFIVRTGNTYVRVLGTEFNVEAYAEEDEVRVSLLSGKVQFGESPDNLGVKPDNSIPGRRDDRLLATLQPGNMAIYSKTNHHCEISPVSYAEKDGWMDGAIVFNEVPFKDAVHRLALRYDWRVIWKERSLADKLSASTVTAIFRRETPEQMLAGLAFTNQFHYSFKDKTLTIY